MRRIAFALLLAWPTQGLAAEITVFAAASLKDALDPIAAHWQAETGNGVVVSYGGSAALAKQIQQGAPADIFVSAAVNWMDTLQRDALIQAQSRVDLLGNSLVLVAHGSDAAPVTLSPDINLAALLGGNKLAMGMVDSVPAGQYGKEALTSLGLWDDAEPFIVQSENVRASLALVASGEAGFGIVYGSDAIADDQAGDMVSVIATFPESSHAPIIYPVALTNDAKPEAQAFLAALQSPAAKDIFQQQGFTPLQD